MKFRKIILNASEAFQVPSGIQRIDTKSTHGWQVRYQGTKFFSDRANDKVCARSSMDRATEELLDRIAKYPAPITVQTSPTATKTSDLPSGISGPIVRTRSRSTARMVEFSIILPRHGQQPHRRTVYIGNENSYTSEKYNDALAKAIELRRVAEKAYQIDATQSRRAAAKRIGKDSN